MLDLNWLRYVASSISMVLLDSSRRDPARLVDLGRWGLPTLGWQVGGPRSDTLALGRPLDSDT
jgi:hypothetical protein